MIKRKDNCLIHGLTEVFLIEGKGNFACIKCLNSLKSELFVEKSRVQILVSEHRLKTADADLVCKA